MAARSTVSLIVAIGSLVSAERLLDVEWPAPTEDVSVLPVVEWLQGSTRPAKVSWIDSSGQVRLFVRKSSPNPEAAAMEAMVNRIYDIFGVSAPRCRLYNDAIMLCRWLDDLKSTYTVQELLKDSQAIAQLDKHYLLDALLQNYDLAGNHGNVGQLNDGTVIRIDNGGSLAMLAKGVPKHVNIDGLTPWIYRIKTWTAVPYDVWDYRRYFSWQKGAFSPWQTATRGQRLRGLTPQVQELVNKRGQVLKMIEAEFPKYKASIGKLLYARIDCLQTFSLASTSADHDARALLHTLEARASNGDEIFEALGAPLVEKMQSMCIKK